jgi:hypothetical protein
MDLVFCRSSSAGAFPLADVAALGDQVTALVELFAALKMVVWVIQWCLLFVLVMVFA